MASAYQYGTWGGAGGFGFGAGGFGGDGRYPHMGSGGVGGDGGDLDPYEVLGVPRNATRSQIKSAYHRLALRHHPDKVQGDGEAKAAANAKFAEISHAYELLTRGRGEGGVGQPDASGQPDAADCAAGGGYAGPPPQSSPFMRGGGFIDPFGAFDSFLFGGPRMGMGGMGMPQDPFFRGFQFTDPFELFRETFGADLGGGGGMMMDDPFLGSQRQQVQRSSVNGSGTAGGGMLGSFPPMFGSMMGNGMAIPPQQGNFTSYSYSSSNVGGTGVAGSSVSTTTSIVNGKRVTRTERTVINPDGSRQTTVDLTGDDNADCRPAAGRLLEYQERSEKMSRQKRRKKKNNSSRRSRGDVPRTDEAQSAAAAAVTSGNAEDSRGNNSNNRGQKRKLCDLTRCLACCFPTLRKRRRIHGPPPPAEGEAGDDREVGRR